jgi:hypothetical protein
VRLAARLEPSCAAERVHHAAGGSSVPSFKRARYSSYT